jgi:hypothetical protein
MTYMGNLDESLLDYLALGAFYNGRGENFR